MQIKKILLLCVLFSLNIFAEELTKVKITVISNSLNENDTVYISGNNSQFGNWSPTKVSLTKVNDSTFSHVFEFKKDFLLEYKFTKGKWANEAVNENGNVPSNYILRTKKDTSLTYKINYWKDQFEDRSGNVKGQITGNVKYHKNLKYKFLQERDLIIWLPQNYEISKENYPVLYMHDGQNIIDPETATFGIDWQIDETVDSLIKQNVIDPMIIVGINNTPDRMFEYTPNDTGYVYMDFIINKVKPLIDSIYRTKPEREYTYTGGSSAGGLISFMLLWDHSEIFSKAICMSPAFKIGRIDYVAPVISYSGKKKDIQIYIDNGGIGLEENLQHGVDDMLAALENKGYKEGQDYLWIKDKNAEHSEPAWALRLPNALKWLFKK